MPTKILIVDSATFKIPASQWAGAESIQLNQIKDSLTKAGKDPVLLIGGPFLKGDDQFTALLDESPNPISFLQFSRGEDATRFSPNLAFFASDSRTAGVKSALATGSTIYTDSFMTGALMGLKIDACYEIARKHLKPGAVLGTWAAVQTLIFLGLHSLPDQGTGGNGEKVDLQIGADANKLAFSVQFPLAQAKLSSFRSHQLLDSLRAAGACFEVRYHKTGNRCEILAVFFVGETPEWPVECHTFTPETPLEDATTVQGYNFRLLGSDTAPAQVKSGGPFKKKFSEKMKDGTSAEAGGGSDKKLAAQVASLESAINEKDKMIMAQQKQIAELKQAAPLPGGTAPAPSPDKELAAKVKSLEGAIVEKDKMISAQMKAITELKASAANTAVAAAGPAINGKEALLIQKMKEQITKLEDELAEALEREQEQEGQETLPAGVKEQLLRKVKDLEVKLKAAQDERNGKLIALEKQLEDNKKKMKDMSKRITELTEQLRDAA